MFSLNFQYSGWINRYFSFRASTPITLPEPYLEFAEEDFTEENFAEFLGDSSGVVVGLEPIIGPILEKCPNLL